MSDWYDMQLMIYGVGLLMPRIAAAFAFSGFMSRSFLPTLIRNFLAINMGVFLYPIIMSKLAKLDWSWNLFMLILSKEIFLGTFIGLLTGVIFWAVESAGYFIDNQRGGAIASAINPMSGITTTPLGIFFMQLVIVYFFVSGIFLFFLSMLFDSYVIWPVWQLLPTLKITQIVPLLSIMDKLLLQTFLISAPIIITMFLGELGLGLINRFAPQLQVFFISMSVKSLLLFLVLIFYFTFLMDLFREMLMEIRIIPKILLIYLEG